MSKDKKPQCPFIQRFAEDLKLARKSERPLQSYCRAVRKLSEHLGHDPNQASEEDIRNYMLFMTEQKKLSSSTVNVDLQALKLYYRITCPRDWAILKLARVKVEQKLPVVISVGEVQTLLKLIEKPSMNCFFTVVYHLGLRLNEALHLQISDIDSKRMMVHIHRGKGAKDRMVPLPEVTLDVLRKHWSRHRTRGGSFQPKDATTSRPQKQFSLQKVRHFGFMHTRSKVPKSWLSMLVTVTLNLTYTLMVGTEPVAVNKPAARCPECGGELECLGVGEYAIRKLRLRAASVQAIVDSS